jgi:hypothetical protein
MQTTSAERGQNVTMLAFCNIAGSFGLFNGSGWMDGENFLKSLQHFQKHVKSWEADPVLLLVDNHSSNFDYAAVKYCKENFIKLLTFPPHCSHVLQPEDVGIYGPFRNYFAVEQQELLRTHPGQRITIHHIAELSRNPFLRAFTPINIVSSFEKTGIHPFKEFLPDDIRFIPSIVTELPPGSKISYLFLLHVCIFFYVISYSCIAHE